MNIGKTNEISKIDTNAYFESLLLYLEEKQVITELQKQQIMMDSVTVFYKRMKRFNGGDSSVSKESGQTLMDSIVFTMSHALKKVPLDMAIKIVLSKSVEEIYQIGLSLIKEELLLLKKEIGDLQAQLFITNLQVYNDTILEGLSGFLKIYNFDYTPQLIGITADYQTCILPKCHGIEFMQEYVTNLTIENQFCCCFSTERVHQLLVRFHDNYQYLICNISEVILIEILGLALLQKDLQVLLISEKNRTQIEIVLNGVNKQELLTTLQSVYNKATNHLTQLNKEGYHYFYQMLPHCRDVIYHYHKLHKLEKIFL